jgi:hypothetical protein
MIMSGVLAGCNIRSGTDLRRAPVYGPARRLFFCRDV